jgi:hypothetical protein
MAPGCRRRPPGRSIPHRTAVQRLDRSAVAELAQALDHDHARVAPAAVDRLDQHVDHLGRVESLERVDDPRLVEAAAALLFERPEGVLQDCADLGAVDVAGHLAVGEPGQRLRCGHDDVNGRVVEGGGQPGETGQ